VQGTSSDRACVLLQEQSHHDFVEVDADMEGDAVVVGEEAQADDLLRQRDAFLASLKGLPRQEVCVENVCICACADVRACVHEYVRHA